MGFGRGEKMKEADKKNKKDKNNTHSTMLIASYREEYTDESIRKMKDIIKDEQPDRIAILKIIEREPTSELVEANVGREGMEDFLESVLKEKKEKADEYASGLLDMTEELNIPTEVHLRKGEDVAEEIIEGARELNADKVVIHTSEKGAIGKFIKGSTGKEIKKTLEDRELILLS